MKTIHPGNQDARAEILQRVRQRVALVRTEDDNKRRHAAEAWINARQRGPQPDWREEGLQKRFLRQLALMSCTVERVASAADAPAAVERYLATNELGREAVVNPALGHLKWQEAGLTVSLRAALGTDRVGITGCCAAVAETGTLMLVSGPETPPSVSLLPETHVAVLAAAAIVPTLEEALGRLRTLFPAMPPAINFISGPSRTADIEQTLVLGAHGPCRVHVVLLSDQ